MPDAPAIRITAIDQATAVISGVERSLTGLASVAQSAFAALGVVLSVAGLVEFTKSTVDAAAHLNELSKATGSSVENLSRIANQARVAGVDVETMSALLYRMSAAMSGVGQGGKVAQDALKALSVTAQDPAEALQQVAVALDRYADGSNKAALTQAILRRSGYEVNAMLHDMATNTDVVATVTTQQAEESERLERQIRLIGVEMTTLKTIILSDLVPALETGIAAFIKARQEGLGFFDSFIVAGTYADRIGPSIDATTKKIGELQDKIKSNPQNWYDAGVASWTKQLSDAEKELRVLISMRDSAIMRSVASMGFTGDARDLKLQQKPIAPSLASGDTTGIDKVQQALDAEQKSMQNALETEQKWTEVDKLFNKFSGDTLATLTARQKVEFDSILNMAKRIDLDKAHEESMKAEAEAAKKLTEWTMKEIEEDDKLATAKQKLIEDRIKIVEDLEFEVKAMTMSNAEREKATLLMQLESKGLEKNSALYQDYAQRINDAVDTKQALQQQIDFWGKIDDAAHDAFTHIYEGSKSVFDRIKESMRSLFLELAYWMAKKWVLNIVAGGAGSTASLASAASSNMGGSFLGGTGGLGGLLGGLADSSGLTAGMGNLGLGLGFSPETATWMAANAVPIVGTILAVGGGLILNWLNSKKGGPKQAGDYTTGGAAYSFFPGEDTAQGNAQVKALIDANDKAYSTLIKAFGGKGSAIFRQGFDTDPQGTASNRLVTMAFVAGKQVYQSVLDNLGKDTQALADAMALENKRALIAALKGSDLPGTLSKLFASIAPETLTSDLADNLLTFSQAYLNLYNVFNANPMDDALKAVADAATGAQGALSRQGQALLDLLATYDSTGAATTDLATATQAYYTNVVTLIAQLEQLKTTIKDMFASSIKTYTFAGLDKAGQYNYLRDEAAALQKQLASTTDAATIDRLAKQIDQDMRDAFGMLSPEQQAAQAGEFIKGANTVNDLAQKQIIAAQKAAQDQSDAILTAIKTAIDNAASNLSGAAADLSGAADDLSGAAGSQQPAGHNALVTDGRRR
jgi:hypothetical protein